MESNHANRPDKTVRVPKQLFGVLVIWAMSLAKRFGSRCDA
ncbi:hypothetical protein THTE_3200 [Thermogutta terrifontis]|uniref:Uncharacterized protein n=1 Tax=Thermogutta terrifontis TaxID=1331910 RepID=A0A286RIQ3_9BACT|nr:hypothetical protein THTE_3200 [Thermogutta terrifontis]